MYGKMCLLLLDFIILTHSSPGRFYHDFYTDTKPQWGQDWGHGWGQEWYNTPTTKRVKITTTTTTTTRDPQTTTTTTEATRAVPISPQTSSIPQPIISDVDIRLGELTTNSGAPSFQIQKLVTEKLMLQAFAPGPEDSKIPASEPVSSAIGTGVENAEETLEPDGKSLWHVAIYERKADHFDHICGGSLIKEDTVISAGHCFWSPVWKELPTTQFKVAAGKRYSQYDDPRDTNVQYSDIKNVSTSEMIEPCLQPDLAMLNLATPFTYTSAVRPVCLKLTYGPHEAQLIEGNTGTVASWAEQVRGECRPSSYLNWLWLPFVSERRCQTENIYNTIGWDRICAGKMNNGTHCETDSGNGLVFYQGKIPYLQGVTTNVVENSECTNFLTRSFTNIIGNANNLQRAFEAFFENFNLEQCKDFYTNPNKQADAPVTEFGEGFKPVAPPEDDEVYVAQGLGSLPVPTLPGLSGPIYQWHVGIYSKAWAPYMQICGGSLVKRDFVLSAAHCFWDDAAGQQPASLFAVAGGKLYRPWNDTLDIYAQQSDVSQITLPARFRGAATSFQDDIAILRLTTPFTYASAVQSVCVSFEKEFEREQLQPRKTGIVCGWGLTEENGRPSQILTYLQLPYVDVEDCFANSEPAFLKYITSDKICAGDTVTGKALCRGDSGGGFVVYSGTTPYLHGVASTAAGNENLCNAFALAAFTSLYSHRSFITDNIPDIEKECARPGNATVTTERNERITGTAGIGIGGPTGIVGTGNEIRTGNGEVGTSPAFPPLPYYPNHFVCNCNCKR